MNIPHTHGTKPDDPFGDGLMYFAMLITCPVWLPIMAIYWTFYGFDMLMNYVLKDL